MKISTISELIKADDGFVPEAIKATVDKVYEVREGEGKKTQCVWFFPVARHMNP